MTWSEGIKNDMKKMGLGEHVTLDRGEWEIRIFVNDAQEISHGTCSRPHLLAVRL